MSIGGIGVRGTETARYRCTIFGGADALDFGRWFVIGACDRNRDRGRLTGIVCRTGVIHRFIGKRDLAGFTRRQILEVIIRVEAKGAVIIIGDRPFIGLGQDIEGVGIGRIRIRGTEAARYRCTIFRGTDTYDFSRWLVIGACDRNRDRGRLTGVVCRTGVIDRFIGKRDLAGFTRRQILEVITRVEAEGAVTVIGYRPVIRLGQDIERVRIGRIRVRCTETARYRCTIFGGADALDVGHRLIIRTGNRYGDSGRRAGRIILTRAVHRFIGKRDLTGFTRSQILKAIARVEAEGTIIIIGDRPFIRLGQNLERMRVAQVLPSVVPSSG